jgi:predicted DNA-binding WGR domain protein
MPRYEVSDGVAHKFWEITLAGKTFSVRWGRLGTRGQSQVKRFDSEAIARSEYDKLVASKRWSAFAHLKTVRASVGVDFDNDTTKDADDRTIRRLKAQTTAAITLHRLNMD